MTAALSTLLIASVFATVSAVAPIVGFGAKAGKFPVAFLAAAACLVGVCQALHRAVCEVRRERQRPFRRSLVAATAGAFVFAVLQVVGLLGILPADRNLVQQTSGLNAFLIAVVSMHGLIVLGAFTLTARVVVETVCDRYDHEYYMGVQACAMLWYGLTVTWGLVLLILAIVA